METERLIESMTANNPLVEKWAPVLANEKFAMMENADQIKDTARLLENTETEGCLAESNLAGGVENWDPVIMSLVRRLAPKLIAYDVCGVQPMTGPTGLIFALKARYAQTPPNGNPQGGAEALFNEANSAYSGTGTHVQDNPWHVDFATGVGKATADGEVDAWASMGVTIEKETVIAKARQLRADYSLELAQDMKRIHGLDADSELINILSAEVISEINREVVRTIYTISKPGAQFASTPGQYDLLNDADGRWSAERYKGLMFAMERDANAIAIETRRGKGNIIITSSDVASALAMAGILDYAPALASGVNLDVDATGATYAGRCGRFKLYVDPYLSVNGYAIGFKGAGRYDAGMFYCPYVPLQLARAKTPSNFHEALGFKTRYGIVANPFTTMTANSNVYYRKAMVLNLS